MLDPPSEHGNCDSHEYHPNRRVLRLWMITFSITYCSGQSTGLRIIPWTSFFLFVIVVAIWTRVTIPEATLTAMTGFTSLNYQSLYDMSLFPLAQSCDLLGGIYYVVSNPRAR